MNAIIIEGVRCTKLTSKKLQLEVPQAMTGEQLRKWQDKHRNEVFDALESEEETEEPVKHKQE